jgi:integrase
MTKSRQALDGKIVHVARNVAIYKINASPYWRARIWIPSQKKRVVRSTKSTQRMEALKIAEDYARELSQANMRPVIPRHFTFEYFADLFLKQQAELVSQGKRHPVLQRMDTHYLYNTNGGLIDFFKERDVREIQTKDVLDYLSYLRNMRPSVKASSSFNHILSCFRKVMIAARDQGAISMIPSTPRPERSEAPRAFFRFAPLVSKERDQYKKLLHSAKTLGETKFRRDSVVVTRELYEFVLWQTHTFMRPTASEAFAVRFQDVGVARNPERLLITLKKGKTGYRNVSSMPAAVNVFHRLQKRNHSQADYLFLPHVKNRANAAAYMGRMFRVVLKQANLTRDEYGEGALTLYSLRHTAICMRLVLSHGKVNIYNLAKNAGTSVEQIERFYVPILPQSAEMARNLQSFGGD